MYRITKRTLDKAFEMYRITKRTLDKAFEMYRITNLKKTNKAK